MKIIEKIIMESQRGLLSYLGAEFLSMADVHSLQVKVAKRIKKEYSPDIIVGIDRGGTYPAYCLSKEMKIPYTTMDISRKRKYIGGVEITGQILISKLLRESHKNPIIKTPFKYSGNAQRALIVDDDCGSMKTLNLAKSHLKKLGLESKTSVVLNTTNGTPDFFSDIQVPLSKLVKGAKRFPWAQYSPYFKDYELWVQNNTK